MSSVVCRLCNSESGTHMSNCPVMSKLCWSMGKAPDAEKIRLAEQLTEALARMSAAERKLLDYEGKEMLYSGRTELAAFKRREQDVQEVIRLTGVYEAAAIHGTKAALDKAVFDLLSANLKLAEFRP